MNNSPFEPEAFEFDFEDRRSGRIRPSFPPRPPAADALAVPWSSRAPNALAVSKSPARESASRAPSQGRPQRGTSPAPGVSLHARERRFDSLRGSGTWPRLRPFMQTTSMSSSVSGGADSDMIRMIQSQLSALGFRVPVTGVLGPATRRAVRLFQQSVGLPANGSLDRRTVQTLRAATSRRAQPAPQAAPFADDGLADAGRASRSRTPRGRTPRLRPARRCRA